MFEPSLSSREPFIHARSEQHLAAPGLWLVLGIQRRTVDGPCPLGSHGWGAQTHLGPWVTKGFKRCNIHRRPYPCHPFSKAGPHAIPSSCCNFSAVATTRRTCHRVCLSCAFPTPDKLHENQDLVCVPPSPTPAPGTQ